MLGLDRVDTPPRVVQVFCILVGFVTLVALGAGVLTLTDGTDIGRLTGVVILAVGLIQAAILAGLWIGSRRAWQAATVLYTLALLLNVLAQNVVGLVLDTGLILFLMHVQNHYSAPESVTEMTDPDFDADA
jgi:uncharacterized membrane protein